MNFNGENFFFFSLTAAMSNDQRASPQSASKHDQTPDKAAALNSTLASLHSLANLTGSCNTNSTNSSNQTNGNSSSAANASALGDSLTNSAMLKFNQDLLAMMQMQNNNLLNGDLLPVKLENLKQESAVAGGAAFANSHHSSNGSNQANNNSNLNNNLGNNLSNNLGNSNNLVAAAAAINPLFNATNGLNLLQQLAGVAPAANNLANTFPLATLLAASAGQNQQHNQMLLQAMGLGKLSNGSNGSNSLSQSSADLAEQLQQLQQQQFQQNLQQLLLLNQLGQQNGNGAGQANNSPLNPLLSNGLQSLLFPNQALLQQGKLIF